MRKRHLNGQFKKTSPITLLWERPVFAWGLILIVIVLPLIPLPREYAEEVETTMEVQEIVVSVEDTPAIAIEPEPYQVKCIREIDEGLAKYGKTAFSGRGVNFVDSIDKVSAIVGDFAGPEAKCKSAKWAVAIGLTESGGKHVSGAYNYWGLQDYKGRTKWENFTSVDNGIETYVFRTYRSYLRHNNFDAYRGKYCQSACTNWEKNVSYFLNLLNY